jgi:hypothetical protein
MGRFDCSLTSFIWYFGVKSQQYVVRTAKSLDHGSRIYQNGIFDIDDLYRLVFYPVSIYCKSSIFRQYWLRFTTLPIELLLQLVVAFPLLDFCIFAGVT